MTVPVGAWAEGLPFAVAVFDATMHLTTGNSRYLALTGLTAEQAAGRLLVEAFPNALADLSYVISAVTQRGAPETRVVVFRQGEQSRTVEVTIACCPEGTGWTVACVDVTEREELRRTLARSVEELETIFATLPDEVRVFGASGEIVRQNATARDAHIGITPTSVRVLWQTDRPRTTDGEMIFLHEHPAARALAGESVRDAQFRLQRAGRDVTLEVNAEPLRDENGALRGAVTVERDVSERAALARAMEAQVKAREERLAAIGRLAAGVVHDVNNVLNPILAAAYLAEQGAEDATAVREYAQRITMAAEIGVSTLARLRRFIRQEPFNEKDESPVDVGVVLDEVLMLAEPAWTMRPEAQRIRVRRSLAEGVVVRGVPGELREAALNLIHNASDAMPEGGVLHVTVAAVDQQAVITIRDSGVGMSPEVRDRAFEPFFSTKGSRGTGLGLAEVYGIVKRHRGVVELDTALGAGTSVIVRIPLSGER